MEKVPGKTVGSIFGAGGAVAYAKDATTDTMYLLGWEALPDHVAAASANLLNGFWGTVIVLLGLYLGHLSNRAVRAWGPGGGSV